MHLALCLLNYSPAGGRERNFLGVARACRDRGHTVEVLTSRWEGERPDGIAVREIACRGFSNHARAARFAAQSLALLQRERVDLVVGFERMPGLDLYYAADVCYVARIRRHRPFWARLTQRYRTYADLERAVFAPESTTEILILSEKEKHIYQSIYHTPEPRFHLVPAGVDKKRIRSAVTPANRTGIRAQLGCAAHDTLLLMIGSHFSTKGVDRAIRAVAALPGGLSAAAHLVIIGRGNQAPYRRLAHKLGIAERVRFMGVREDVPLFLAGADLLLQPSRTENTGNAIVEALVAGIPVLATDICGYAVHVERSGAGKTISGDPFRQKEMNTVLRDMVAVPCRNQWRQKALAYTDAVDLYSRLPAIVDLIERRATAQKARIAGP